jgi:predicted RNase H-like HicB family nuclease
MVVLLTAREFIPFQWEMRMSMSQTRRIELEEAEDGEGWVSRDLETGVASQGPTKEAALQNLDEAVELFERDSEYDPEKEREIMEEIGLDPDRQAELRAEREGQMPEFMQG